MHGSGISGTYSVVNNRATVSFPELHESARYILTAQGDGTCYAIAQTISLTLVRTADWHVDGGLQATISPAPDSGHIDLVDVSTNTSVACRDM